MFCIKAASETAKNKNTTTAARILATAAHLSTSIGVNLICDFVGARSASLGWPRSDDCSAQQLNKHVNDDGTLLALLYRGHCRHAGALAEVVGARERHGVGRACELGGGVGAEVVLGAQRTVAGLDELGGRGKASERAHGQDLGARAIETQPDKSDTAPAG